MTAKTERRIQRALERALERPNSSEMVEAMFSKANLGAILPEANRQHQPRAVADDLELLATLKRLRAEWLRARGEPGDSEE